MYEPVRLLDHRPELTWLTIGDGRFGLDSIRIRRYGFDSVLPSDISDTLLKEAKARGLIESYAVENAESLTFPDDSFDVVFCKESYHHFPRAPLALFEMLRVCRLATILIEPRDVVVDPVRPNSRDLLRLAAAKVMNRVAPRLAPRLGLMRRYAVLGKGPYETAGNFVYSVSAREIEKIALGSNLPAVAFKGLCDQYAEGVEFADKDSDVARDMLRNIRQQEHSFEIGAASTTLLMAIVFKQLPERRTIERLQETDWLYLPLSRNPYIS
jgi:SAM-dependent methyltransferase